MVDNAVLCALCALQGKTCCVETDIFVTKGDVRRIFDFTKKHDFYEFRRCATEAYRDQTDDPQWDRQVFRPDGTRRVVKRETSGRCLFLSTTGCTLPLDIRPLVCRLHPHLYNAQGFYPELAPECPIHLLSPGKLPEQTIQGFRQEEAEHWHHLLYQEIMETGVLSS
jgi:Fe-S-cluster containining protein